MWTGVDRGFAGIKFSGSPRMSGKKREMIINVKKRRVNPTISLNVK